jgi:hypothetical protein
MPAIAMIESATIETVTIKIVRAALRASDASLMLLLLMLSAGRKPLTETLVRCSTTGSE